MILEILNNLKYRRIKNRYDKTLRNLPQIKLTSNEKNCIVRLFKPLNIPVNPNWGGYYKYYLSHYEPLCITPDVWKYMEMSLNPKKYRIIQNKGILHKFIDKRYLPVTIINKINGIVFDQDDNILTKEEAIIILSRYEAFVYKPTVGTGGGKGVELVELKNLDREFKRERCEKLINGSQNFICQEVLQCSTKISKYNRYESTVNSIRCFTLNLNGKVSVISSYLRMSYSNTVKDNVGASVSHKAGNIEGGGAFVGVRQDGTLSTFGLNRNYEKIFESPSGIILKGERLNFYDKICETATAIHSKLPMLGFIAFDMTIDISENVRVIEINLDSQDIEDHHIFNGAVFKERLPELLDYVVTNRPNWY